MKTPERIFVLSLCALLAVSAGADTHRKGRVMFWYDTEDYVSPAAHDGTLFHAKLLTEFGLKGNFALVGFYAQTLLEQGRLDVIAALKKHCVGSQTLYHSRHPTICEYTDVADWNAGYRRCLAEEAECVGMLKAVFGLDEIQFFVPPGTSVTPVPMYAYADMGVPVYAAGIDVFGDNRIDRLAWYANMLQIPYHYGMGRDAKAIPSNDVFAERNLTVIFTHPNEAFIDEWWDVTNFKGKNMTPWRQWRLPHELSPERRAEACAGVRALMTRIKNDPRLTVVSCDDIVRDIRPRVAIRRSDASALLAKLSDGLEPIESPASWCVSDVFQAAVAFLRGADEFKPGKAWGFLERPVGVTKSVTLQKADLVACAKALKTDGFIPARLTVGGETVGPADFLIAALTVLAKNADTATVGPRDQLGPVGKHLKNLPKLNLAGSWCIYADDFTDKYVSERLRLQFWTLRYE